MSRKMIADSCQLFFSYALCGWKKLVVVVLTMIFCQTVQAQQLVLPFSASQEASMAFSIDSVSLARINSLASDGTQTLGLRMQFCVVGVDLPKGNIVILTPRLSDNTHTVAFPAVEIYGSWAYFSSAREYEDSARIAVTAMQLRSKDAHSFLTYHQAICWEPWMNEATLRFDLSYQDGCGSVLREESRVAFASTVASALTTASEDSECPEYFEKLSFRTYRALFALKTNLLYDLIVAPNIEVEVPIDRRGRWSVMAEYWTPWYRWKRLDYAYEIQGGGLELRRWFAPRCDGSRPFLTGHFFGAYGAAARYDLENDGTGDQGEVFSGGLTYGYSLPLGRHWNLEMSVSGGVVFGERRHYNAEFESTHLIYKYTKNMFYAGPTKLKLSLVWIIGKKGGRS